MVQSPACYLDNNATTRVAPEAVEAMLPFLTETWGNASSPYAFGRHVAAHVEAARAQVAALVNAEPGEVFFTSGGTESNNTAVQSALAVSPGKRHIITTAVEHPATLRFCEMLSRRGYDVTVAGVDADGQLDLGAMERAIRPETALVTAMWGNNETGVLFPVAELAARCRRKGVLFHTDAVQAAGKVAVDVRAAEVDYLSLSAHKLHGPKGAGALFVRRGTRLQPYLIGGRQEHERRAGTENVAGIVGFGRAAQVAASHLLSSMPALGTLRDRLEQSIFKTVPGTHRNGPREPRLPNTANLAFDGIEAEALLLLLDQQGICVSSGSACSTGSLEPSHVLTAMGIAPERARSSLRFSLSRYTSTAELDRLLHHLPAAVERLRGASPARPQA